MFDFLKNSRFFSRPVELYLFSYGENEQAYYALTDAETQIVHQGRVYSPRPIRRTAHTNSGTLDKTSFEVEVDRSNPVPELFRVYPPGYVVGLTIFQGEADDPDGAFVPIWVGRVLSCSWEASECKLLAEPVSTSFRRTGLRRNYQYGCPHVLYGPDCKADRVAATISAEVASVGTQTITFTSLISGAGRYAGGSVEWVRADGEIESRTVLNVFEVLGATQFELNGLVRELAPGQSVSASLGCRRTLVSCGDDHNNQPNYGGMPWIPLKNPIGNSSPFK